MSTKQTFGEAMQDPNSDLRKIAEKTQQDRERVIGEWMALGFTREEAYRKALA